MATATRQGTDQGAVPSYFVGSYAGTTAAQTINIGFKPSAILAWNVTDGDTLYLWSVEDESNVVSIIATPATVAEAVTAEERGFGLPVGNTTNEDGVTYVFIAFR